MNNYVIGKIKNYFLTKKAHAASLDSFLKVLNLKEHLKIYRALCQYKTYNLNDNSTIKNYIEWKEYVLKQLNENTDKYTKDCKKKLYCNLIHFYKLRIENIETTQGIPSSILFFILGMIIEKFYNIINLEEALQSPWVWTLLLLGIFLLYPLYIFFST